MLSRSLPVLDPWEPGRRAPSAPGSSTKLAELKARLRHIGGNGLAVAFSGGVDSAFLLWAAAEAGLDRSSLLAITARSPSVPVYDLDDAVDFAEAIDVEHVVVATAEMDDERYRRNDGARCYYCKRELFSEMTRLASMRGLGALAYGFTRSDRGDVRPGARAAAEVGVFAPLDDVGLEKDEIRWLLERAGFDIWDKPASPCLASRIGRGIEVDARRLEDVAALEQMLREAGVRSHRVRISGAPGDEFLRIEVGPAEMDRVIALRDALGEEGRRRGYKWTLLDLNGYRQGGGNE